jgi:RNA polymerase sigma-70 factor, ECF subfamily
VNALLVETQPSDSRLLLERARGGDCEAFCELCRQHEGGLLRHATALCGDPWLAEDLTQDTLVEVWKCLRRYNGRCQFFTWLCAILLNRYRNTVRRKRLLSLSAFSGPERESVEHRVSQLKDSAAWPDQAMELRERAVLVRRCIEALPAKHQHVVYLRFYVDESLEGIAAALGCSLGTVKSRLFHALDKLRAMKALRKQ